MERMKFNLKYSLDLFLMIGIASAVVAQKSTDTFQYKVTGRMLMDGGIYMKNPNDFGNGMEFKDLRIGVKGIYQNWRM